MNCLYAVQHIRKMRGGAQSHLLRASDRGYWVVKTQDNPQHIRVLANEMFASRLGRRLGLPMPQVEVVEVCDWLIQHTPELCVEVRGATRRCSSGLHLASRYVANPEYDPVFDYLPESLWSQVANGGDFVRVLVADKWMGNCDGRQAVFSKKQRERKFRTWFIDQGYCFNAGSWSFPDMPLLGVYCHNYVYDSVTSWQSFEPALSRAEKMSYSDLWECAAGIPAEWYESDWAGLSQLIETLY